MGFIASDAIKVFPCGRRNTTKDPYARLTTEYNLVSIINKLVDMDSFIVTNTSNSNQISNPASNVDDFSFNVAGYLFTTTISDIFTAVSPADNSTAIYACIKIDTSNSNLKELTTMMTDDVPVPMGVSGDELTYLDDGGDNSKFYGVTFVTSLPTNNGEVKHLKLFEKCTDGNWYVAEDSKIKFETRADGMHRSVRIDDGVLS